MRNILKIAPLLAAAWVGLLAAPALAADEAAGLKNTAILDMLLKQTGVYDRSKTGRTPEFVSDPTWPRPLPHSWLLGQIGGLYVDSHDHVWVYQRPRTLNDDEVGLEKALPGATDAKGQPINALGFARVDGFGADCCRAAPSVIRHLYRPEGQRLDLRQFRGAQARRQGNSVDHQQIRWRRFHSEVRYRRQFQDADRRHPGRPRQQQHRRRNQRHAVALPAGR
jgi:hypothetical protein